MKRFAVFLFFLLVLSLPVLSHAEIKEGSVEITPVLGYQIFDAQKHFGSRPFYGGRVGYNITKHIGLEGGFDYVEARASFLHADLVYHFTPDKKLVPFAIGGFGWAHMRPNNREHYEAVMSNFGLGFKYFFTPNMALRADVRDVIASRQSVAATVGLTFAFGGKVTAPPPPPAPAPAPTPEPAPAPAPPPPPAPKVTFRADPPEIIKSQCSTLMWTSEHAKTLSIDQGVGAVDTVGSKPVCPPESTTYTLTASGDGGTTSAKASVGVITIVLEDIHFEFDKATLTKEGRDILSRNLEILKSNPGVKVQIEGHACAHGTEKYNMALSERRALAVKEYLAKGGVDAGRMTTIAYGETRLLMPEKPTAKNKNSTEAKANRRVHFEVIVK